MPEIFGEKEKQYCGVCGLPFGKPLQRKCCFDEAAQRKTSFVPSPSEGNGVVLKITEKSFVSSKLFS